MQGAMTFRHNGSTRKLTFRSTISRLTLGRFECFFLPLIDNTPTKEFKFFPPHFSHPLECVERLSHIAINLFATQAETLPKQTKSLQWLTHVGFFKAILAILKQSTFIFAKRQAKTNKLCCLRTLIRHPP
jgi:hypothetical protein